MRGWARGARRAKFQFTVQTENPFDEIVGIETRSEDVGSIPTPRTFFLTGVRRMCEIFNNLRRISQMCAEINRWTDDPIKIIEHDLNKWLNETFVFECIDKDELTDENLDVDGEIDIHLERAIWDADVADKGQSQGRLMHFVLDQLEQWTAELHKELNKKYPSGGTGYNVRYGRFHRTESKLGWKINLYTIKI